MLKDHLIQQIEDAIGAVNFSPYVDEGGVVIIVLKSGATTTTTVWPARLPREEINTAVYNVVAKEILRLTTLSHVEADTLNLDVGITLVISKHYVEIVIKLKLLSKEQTENFGDVESVPYHDFELEYGNNGMV